MVAPLREPQPRRTSPALREAYRLLAERLLPPQAAKPTLTGWRAVAWAAWAVLATAAYVAYLFWTLYPASR